jgi:hypothetical protein
LAPGGNPETSEFTATTPALKYIDWSVFKMEDNIFIFHKQATLPVA